MINSTPKDAVCQSDGVSTLTIKNFLNSDLNTPTTTIIELQISQVTNPPSTKPSDPFEIKSFYSDDPLYTDYPTDISSTMTPTLPRVDQIMPGLLDFFPNLITIANPTVGELTSYAFKFNVKNPIGAVGGRVRISFPKEITLSDLNIKGSDCFI